MNVNQLQLLFNRDKRPEREPGFPFRLDGPYASVDARDDLTCASGTLEGEQFATHLALDQGLLVVLDGSSQRALTPAELRELSTALPSAIFGRRQVGTSRATEEADLLEPMLAAAIGAAPVLGEGAPGDPWIRGWSKGGTDSPRAVVKYNDGASGVVLLQDGALHFATRSGSRPLTAAERQGFVLVAARTPMDALSALRPLVEVALSQGATLPEALAAAGQEEQAYVGDALALRMGRRYGSLEADGFEFGVRAAEMLVRNHPGRVGEILAAMRDDPARVYCFGADEQGYFDGSYLGDDSSLKAWQFLAQGLQREGMPPSEALELMLAFTGDAGSAQQVVAEAYALDWTDPQSAWGRPTKSG